MSDRKLTLISLYISLTLVGLMWATFLFDKILDLDLYRFGVYPLKKEGLIGIFLSPFIHNTSDYAHIFNNTLPAFVLTWLLFYHYRTISTKSFVLIYLLSGVGLWFTGRESYHIGMSGVIYGLTSFLVFSGFFRKNMKVAAVSLIVIFLYGSMIWGIFPLKEQVSWEAHAMGLFSGIIVAVLFRKSGPQPSKMRYEIEEEIGVESKEEYWKTAARSSNHSQRLHINYEFVPKEIIVKSEEE